VRLAEALRARAISGRPILVPYVMVDRRRAGRIARIVRALREGGATALELGFPFSDPIADGPVLEAAHERALRDGTRWTDLVAAVRVASRILPTAVMTYANPLERRGLDRALGELSGAGATGLIVPDLSLEETGPFARAARGHRTSLVLLAAPGVPGDRLARIAARSRGFLYVVGQYGTTGGPARGASSDLRPTIAAARRAAPSLPVLVGFGIRDRSSARRALSMGADGVVVGSALQERFDRGAGPRELVRFLRSLGLGDVAPARRNAT
jgi:tryptophan synthase alpha chain